VRFCYKIVFGIVDVPLDDFLSFSTCTLTCGHKFKLYKNRLTYKPEQTFSNKSQMIGTHYL